MQLCSRMTRGYDDMSKTTDSTSDSVTCVASYSNIVTDNTG